LKPTLKYSTQLTTHPNKFHVVLTDKFQKVYTEYTVENSFPEDFPLMPHPDFGRTKSAGRFFRYGYDTFPFYSSPDPPEIQDDTYYVAPMNLFVLTAPSPKISDKSDFLIPAFTPIKDPSYEFPKNLGTAIENYDWSRKPRKTDELDPNYTIIKLEEDEFSKPIRLKWKLDNFWKQY